MTKKRPDMQSEASPDGLEIIQLTTEVDVPSSHIYMEAQILRRIQSGLSCTAPHIHTGQIRKTPNINT